MKCYYALRVLLTITLALTLVGCNPIVTPKETEIKIEIIKPESYSNGVYYFKCAGDLFARSLSSFLSDSTIHLIAVADNSHQPPGSGSEGGTIGYFVITERKNK